MKPKNFPARKLKRKFEALMRAGGLTKHLAVNYDRLLEDARNIRTKKDRSK